MRLRAMKKQTQFKPCPERSRMGQFQRQKKSRYLVVSFLQQECKIETIVEPVSYILQI